MATSREAVGWQPKKTIENFIIAAKNQMSYLLTNQSSIMYLESGGQSHSKPQSNYLNYHRIEVCAACKGVLIAQTPAEHN